MLSVDPCLISALSACWLEEEDRVSHRQGLHGAWQGKLKPVQLRGLSSGKRDWENVNGRSTWAELPISLWTFCSDGHQPLSSPTQRPTSEWIVLHGGFLSEGLVDLWSACPLGREYCSYLLSVSRELCYDGRRRKTHRCSFCCFVFLFFMEMKNIYLQT